MASEKKHDEEKHSKKGKGEHPVFKEGKDVSNREVKGDEEREESVEKTAEVEVVEEVPVEETTEAEALKRELDEARDLLEKLRVENETLRDTAARAAADFYNFRKRVEREAQQTRVRVAAQTAEMLLPVLDNFDRALDSRDGGETLGLRKGVEMVREQFFGVLKDLGVETIEAEGKLFDPALHEAVAVEETTEAPDGTVIEEFQRGFLFGGKVLRASKVKVARQTEKSEETGNQDQ
ncbi:MAG: nucleotide exchange factor GrpE [Thermovirgaceae bacterium]